MNRNKSHFQENEPILEKLLQRIRFHKVIPFVKNGYKVLDLGCGYDGVLLQTLSSKISEGVGIDVSVTKNKVAKNIRLITSKKNRLPPNHFDLAICLAVIEHLEDPQTFLNHAYKSLKSGGNLIITTPSPVAKPILEYLAFKVGVISKQEIKDHKKYYNTKELKELLAKSGFKSKNINIHTFSFGFNTFALAKK